MFVLNRRTAMRLRSGKSWRCRRSKDLANCPTNLVNKSLDHALRLALPIESMGGLSAHGWKDIVACRQTDKERERNEPDAEAKIRSDLGETWHVGLVVVRGPLVGAGLCIGKVSEPNVVVDEHENCVLLARANA